MINRKCQILAHPSNVRKFYWFAPENLCLIHLLRPRHPHPPPRERKSACLPAVMPGNHLAHLSLFHSSTLTFLQTPLTPHHRSGPLFAPLFLSSLPSSLAAIPANASATGPSEADGRAQILLVACALSLLGRGSIFPAAVSPPDPSHLLNSFLFVCPLPIHSSPSAK